MHLSYGLTLPTDVRYVSVVRRLCTTTLSELGVTSACVADIALAVTEACANVVQHGEGSDFEVLFGISDGVARITIRDAGAGFDGVNHPPADEDADPEGGEYATSGRGIQLMRLLVDQLAYEPDESGTRVVLVRHLDVEPDSVLAIAT